MRRIKSKLSIAVIAVAAIVLITGLGAYAYWTVSHQLAGNTFSSGHMSIDVTEGGTVVQPMIISDLMPGNNNFAAPREYKVTSADGNPNVDLAFGISNVVDDVSLADNVQVAFLLCTGNPYAYWLTPTGNIPDNTGTFNNAYLYNISEFNGKSWSGLTGFTDIAENDFRHIKVYYSLPLDCAPDCHDDNVTWDMSFELMQSH